ncbi:MAG: hypothetical protein H7Y14_05930 [Burkholderiales bacterium]|nr:hypothetical protein [Burkholderiales bacterium]
MADLPKQLPPDVAQALARGNLVEAIKLLRTKHNIGLAEAKGLLDAIQNQAKAGAAAATAARSKAQATMHPMHAHQHEVALPPDPSHLSPGEMPRSSSGAVFAMVVVVIAFAIGVAMYFRG